MRILIYSDLHICRNSSILPSLNNSLYTYREDMIIKTGVWLSQIMVNEKVDAIINCGDTFDQATVTSYDIETASTFFKSFSDRMAMNNLNIPQYVVVGNHEMINNDFNAIALLDNIPNITVIKEPTTIGDLAFIPYMNEGDILKFPEGKYLFSHLDIQGSAIRGDFVLPTGIAQSKLSDNYKFIFNGHIHKPSIMNNIINVGSVTTHSFADDNNCYPQAYIFNTETLDLLTYTNYMCPLFRKYTVNSIEELQQIVNNIDRSFKYVFQITCPFEIKEEVKNYMSEINNIVISYRLRVKVNKEIVQTNEQQENVELHTNIDVQKSFQEFLDTVEDLKVPKQYYLSLLESITK